MNRALKKIFDENYSPLCNYANAIVKDKHMAEDIVQTVFIQLWENEKIFHLETPESYLLKCVRNKCINHLKRPQRKNEILMEVLPDIGKEEKQSLKDEDIMALLHFFADKLPPKMRQVFLMSRQQGMTYKEIAQDLDVSIKTIENQMGSALKKLRILLQKHHYLPMMILFFQ